jgi:hypothetical protein
MQQVRKIHTWRMELKKIMTGLYKQQTLLKNEAI